ncbi:beta-glucosidase 24-like [Cucumis melo var. makuwa]|uniref:Beta-glucosidase 24-like n=1 Tax=Cucumis melo var. makuwa TaxID=1194695 RepID=A0A5D3DPG5_CUCMM|nr:beta-glucosidase 24-like [Cucumis melo var. makuwa]
MDSVKRRCFPQDFVFGTASSAYQFEGAASTDGKGPSIWDTFTHKHPEKIEDGSNGDVAADSYNRYKEDVAIMKEMGFDAYRFSIAWSRILPNGKLSGGVNEKGIEYYNNLINEVIANGIEPYVTLFHWDLPQSLQDEYQGFMSDQIINDFQDYTELCFKEFGDRVKHWITLNEPYIFILQSYVRGEFAPCSCHSQHSFDSIKGDCGNEPYIVGHNQILAHAVVVKLYKTKYQAQQKGKIGIVQASNWCVPYSDGEEDKRATTERDGIPIGLKAGPSSWLASYPQGLKDMLIYVKNNYKNPIIYITENGCLDFDKTPMDKLINDEDRIKYFNDHLYSISESIKDGVRVKGYFVWSLLDNFEWSMGFSHRFGLHYIDFYHNNLERIPKASAKWFQNFLKNLEDVQQD